MNNDYRMRKNITVTDDGHTMRATGSNVTETMIAEGYDIGSHTHVDEKSRNRMLNSGDTKKKMSTRRCFDNSKNHRSRVMSNTGEITIHGTVIDTTKASDGEYKNSRCVSTRSDSELLSAKRERFVEMMMKLRK